MNRIVLIGNGFDLAHGLRSSYKHFIDDFWKYRFDKLRKSINNPALIHDDFIEIEVPHFMLPENINDFNGFLGALRMNKEDLVFKNEFLGIISKKGQLQNWVDIEDEYYKQLLKIVKNEGDNELIRKLNSNFDQVKQLFLHYLEDQIGEYNKKSPDGTPKLIDIIRNKIYQPFKKNDWSLEAMNKFAEEIFGLHQNYVEEYGEGEENEYIQDWKIKLLKNLPLNPTLKILKEWLHTPKASKYFQDVFPNKIVLINFNYTPITEMYKVHSRIDDNDLRATVIHVHGELKNRLENPIIFGYGDELDDDYKQIEKTIDNELLVNIKSIRYQETTNYRDLLKVINSDIFQVFIMGHSCGVSDRTLLNTIFEHENCGSIKFFYFAKYDWDNYTDIISNISRCFNSKAKMRDRVVNKTYCESLVADFHLEKFRGTKALNSN